MCGVWISVGPPPTNKVIEKSMNALKARGPEGDCYLELNGVSMGFTRLAINGLTTTGMQPMLREGLYWVCNGEIYNWRALAKEYGIDCPSGSDCEIIGPLYNHFLVLGIPLSGFFRALDGVFALAIVDSERDQIIIARDPYGVRPLYASFTSNRAYYASELKALPDGEKFPVFPGTFQSFRLSTGVLKSFTSYHATPFYKQPALSDVGLACMTVRTALESAVRKRMMTERPVAALLSGGLDSSLIAALIAKELKAVGAPPLKTFSIGMPGSSDLAHAKLVADWIGSDHTEVVLGPDDFFNAIPEVIYAIESYDTTTVRASVGNWLVGKAVAERSDCKVVFNGDGADEVWGSYLYFYGAPSDAAYEEEVTRLLEDIHYFDVLRSDRCISSHGLEPRTPYLDRAFVAAARSIPTELRRPSATRPEKWLMRTAFDDGTLPKEVLWRRKEAFSDGVSGDKAWYQIAQEKASRIVDDLEGCATAEQAYYRQTYMKFFGDSEVNVPYLWMPRWSKATDPSARTLEVY